ncbi:hypothetical protein FDP41_011855 [Naegleria fowleri]|uniref:Protein kinase domain-containing protein n=1 Tax=Naegleria fowleri TaxID=5763 RepID=A0A6A5C686_NAEFO|nr:uncharacterized protein FDP41_011855 [Naegleria fowleri]KAF0981994.1 hypothetical protein FDP41_011855 [Naegleria fowleri]CAG4715426.1 unnamed protein product [Naegleria fowleri]
MPHEDSSSSSSKTPIRFLNSTTSSQPLLIIPTLTGGHSRPRKPSLRGIKISNRFVKLNRELGSGSFSDVYLGEDLEFEQHSGNSEEKLSSQSSIITTNAHSQNNTAPIQENLSKRDRYVAIKQIKVEKYSRVTIKYLEKEIQIMKECKHENVIKLLETIQVDFPSQMYLVMEKCDTNMRKYMNMKKQLARKNYKSQICSDGKLWKPFFSEREIQYWLKQIVSGVQYLHEEKHIIHRDIKPENFLLKKLNQSTDDVFIEPEEYEFGNFNEYKLVIGDFGLSKAMENDHITQTVVGTWPYKSPELAQHLPYGYDADIWSIGVVLFEMIAGYCIFNTKKNEQVYIEKPSFGQAISSSTPNVDWSFLLEHVHISDHLYNLLVSMLRYNKDERISIGDIAKHPFVTQTWSEEEYLPVNLVDNDISNHHEDVKNSVSKLEAVDQPQPLQVDVDVDVEQRSQQHAPLIDPLGKEEIVTSSNGSVLLRSGMHESVTRPEFSPSTILLKNTFEELEFDSTKIREISGGLPTNRSYAECILIQKSKDAKIVVFIINEEVNKNRSIFYSLKVQGEVVREDWLDYSQVRDFEIMEETEQLEIEIELSTGKLDQILHYFSPETVPFRIQVFVQN